MRKKFVTVALLGTLIFTSANFVGCSDYDDDIKNLQEQVDALKSISISDLASQLQSLKDANSNLSLANAKMEAAIAEIKTNIDALKEADKTLTSLVNGKVDQATYQAAIDALNGKCSDLSNKVAALAALETAVNDLKANKADNSTIEELKKAVEKLQTVDSDFATRIGKLENTIENMNTVLAGKADQATVDALAKSIEELKTSVAGIDAKIAKALEPIQGSIAKLQEDLAKKADAATVAADIEKVKSEMTAVINALKEDTAKNLADVKSELAGRIKALEEAEKQMGLQIEALKNNIDALKDRMTKLESQPTTDLTEVKADIKANKEAIDAAMELVGGIQGTINGIEDRLDGLGEETGAVKTYIDNAISSLSTAISTQIGSVSAQLSSLKSEYDLAVADFEGRIAALEGVEHVNKADFESLQSEFNELKSTVGDAKGGLVKQLSDLSDKVDGLIEEALAATGPGTIEDKIAEQIKTALADSETIKQAIADAIATVTGRLDKVEADLGAVLNRIQSIVFVPQYQDASGAIVPVYTINGKNGVIQMKFRVAPAEKAQELVASLEGKAPNSIFSFYSEDALQSRATADDKLSITKVESGTDNGTIVITANTGLVGSADDTYYPVALKLSTSIAATETEEAKPVNDITTDYFNVRVRDINNRNNFTSSFTHSVDYTDTKVLNIKDDLSVMYLNAGNTSLSLADCGFIQDLVIAQIEVATAFGGTRWVDINSSVPADKVAIEEAEKGFVVENNTIKLDKPNIANKGKSLKLRLSDEAIFGKDVFFELTYSINSTAAPSETVNLGVAATKIWSTVADNLKQTFTIDIDKDQSFENLITGATVAEVCEAISNATGTTHKVGDAVAKLGEPTFTINVAGANKALTAILPAGAEYKNYKMTTIYATTLGDITLTATLNLSYPTDKFLIADSRQWENGKYVLGVTTPASGTAYTISGDLSKAYNTAMNGVVYEFALVEKNAKGEFVPLTSSAVSIADKKTITFTDRVDLSQLWIEVKPVVNNNVAGEAQHFQIQTNFPITATVITAKASLPYKGTTLDLVAGLSLNDIYTDGKLITATDGVTTYAKTAYGMLAGGVPAVEPGVTPAWTSFVAVNKELRFVVHDGIVTGETQQTVSAATYFDVDDDGKFTVKAGYESAKEVTVKVDVVVKHKFAVASSGETKGTFTIVIPKTK